MVSPEPATDNRDVEDMELSDVEDDTSKIIGMLLSCGNCRTNQCFPASLGMWRRHKACAGFVGLLGLNLLVGKSQFSCDNIHVPNHLPKMLWE